MARLQVLTLCLFLVLLCHTVNSYHFRNQRCVVRLQHQRQSDMSSGLSTLIEESKTTFSIGLELMGLNASATEITKLCDRIEELPPGDSRGNKMLRLSRSSLLTKILLRNRQEYIEIVTFLGNRIPRNELPNIQDVPSIAELKPPLSPVTGYIADCNLPNITFTESLLDKALLGIFRELVQRETKWKSETKGLLGLLEEGRHYMLSPEGTEESQHRFVKSTLAGLMTPLLPPFYRIFMAGIVPSVERGDPDWLLRLTNSILNALPEELQKVIYPGKQFGPLFYAPFLTSFVTPTFLAFLVGPSRPNRRKDGQLGGIIIEKCKFLQESGCKGLCLHQCKLPAQQFFDEQLGLPLMVSPNFATQECQWSWGEIPLDHTKDPSFPLGCLSGCPTRSLATSKTTGSVSCY